VTGRSVRLGAGAGFSGDRIEPVVELAEHGTLDYLVFECLAERTIALAQQARRRDPKGGFDPLLDARMRAVLPTAQRRGMRIVTDIGAAHPVGAADRTAAIAREMSLDGLKVVAVCGDDVLAHGDQERRREDVLRDERRRSLDDVSRRAREVPGK
jgi:hypothetical protein